MTEDWNHAAEVDIDNFLFKLHGFSVEKILCQATHFTDSQINQYCQRSKTQVNAAFS